MSDSDKQIDDDFDFSRGVYLDLIKTGQEALGNMIDVAQESEHPRAYEVLSGMIKNVSDINDKLMDHHKKKKDMQKVDSKEAAAISGTTTNNVFLGSTTDLQRMLQDASKQAIDITPDDMI